MKFRRTTTLFGKYTKRSDAIQVELRHSCIVFVSFERPAMNRSVYLSKKKSKKNYLISKNLDIV
jgi:hypothetical protein